MPNKWFDFFQLVLENEGNQEICVLTVPDGSKATAYNRACIAYNVVEFLKSTVWDFNCQLLVKYDCGFERLNNMRIRELSPRVIYETMTYHYCKTKNPGIYHIHFMGTPRQFPATDYSIDIKDLDPIPFDVLSTLSQIFPELEAVLQQEEYKEALEKHQLAETDDKEVQEVVEDQKEHLREMLKRLSDSFEKVAKPEKKDGGLVFFTGSSPRPEPTDMRDYPCDLGVKCTQFHCVSCDMCYKNREALDAHVDTFHLASSSVLPEHSRKLEDPQTGLQRKLMRLAELRANREAANQERKAQLNKEMAAAAAPLPLNTFSSGPCFEEYRANLIASYGMNGARRSSSGVFQCKLCINSFENVKSLSAHMRSHAVAARADHEAKLKKVNAELEAKAQQELAEEKLAELTVAPPMLPSNMPPVEAAYKEVYILPKHYGSRLPPYQGLEDYSSLDEPGTKTELFDKSTQEPLVPLDMFPKRPYYDNEKGYFVSGSGERIKATTASSDGMFHCTLCEKSYEKAKSLNAHMKSHEMKARHEEEERIKAATATAVRPQLPCRLYCNNPELGLEKSKRDPYESISWIEKPTRKIGQVLPEFQTVKDSFDKHIDILKEFGSALEEEKTSPRKPRFLMTDQELIADITRQQSEIKKVIVPEPPLDLTEESAARAYSLLALSKPPRPGRVIAQEVADSPKLEMKNGEEMPQQVRKAFDDYEAGILSYFDMKDLLDCLREIQEESGMKTALDIAIDSLELLEIQKRHERKRWSCDSPFDRVIELSAKAMKFSQGRLDELNKKYNDSFANKQEESKREEMPKPSAECQRPCCSKETGKRHEVKLLPVMAKPEVVNKERTVKKAHKTSYKVVDLPPREFHYPVGYEKLNPYVPEELVLAQLHNPPMKTYGKWCKHHSYTVFDHSLKFEVLKPEMDFEPVIKQLGSKNVLDYFVHSCSMLKEENGRAIMNMHLFVVGKSERESSSLVLQLVDKKKPHQPPLSNYIYLTGKYEREEKSKLVYYTSWCRLEPGHELPKRVTPIFTVQKASTEVFKGRLANWRTKYPAGDLVVHKESELRYQGMWCPHVAMPVFKKTFRVKSNDGKPFRPEKWSLQILKKENFNTVILPFVPKYQRTEYCTTLDIDILVIVEDLQKNASVVCQFVKKNSSSSVPIIIPFSPNERDIYEEDCFKHCEKAKSHPWPTQLKLQKFYPSKTEGVLMSDMYANYDPPSKVPISYPGQKIHLAVVQEPPKPENSEVSLTPAKVAEPANLEVVKGDSFSSHTDMQEKMVEEDKSKEEDRIVQTKLTQYYKKLKDICQEKMLSIEAEKVKVEEKEASLSAQEDLEFDIVEKEVEELTETETMGESDQPIEDPTDEVKDDFEYETSESSDYEMVNTSDAEEA